MPYLSEKEFYKRGYRRGYTGSRAWRLFEFPDEAEKAARDRGYAEGVKDRQRDDERKTPAAVEKGAASKA